MPLNVSYKNRIGYYTQTDGTGKKFKNWMCHANVKLWADMYFYTDKEGTKMTQLVAFWCDTTHLKNAMKDDCYHGADDFHFFADQMDANIWKAVKILVEAGKKVTIVKSQNHGFTKNSKEHRR